MTKHYWKWLGEAEFVPGCPARDLTSAEVERRGIRDEVEASPLYKKIAAKKAEKKEIDNGA